jgi:hypothetical protein
MSQTTLVSLARVETDRPSRYLTQLCEHFSVETHCDWTDDSGLIQFDFGACRLVAEEAALVLTAEGPDEASLTRVEQVTGSHLERFGARDELTVAWSRTS